MQESRSVSQYICLWHCVLLSYCLLYSGIDGSAVTSLHQAASEASRMISCLTTFLFACPSVHFIAIYLTVVHRCSWHWCDKSYTTNQSPAGCVGVSSQSNDVYDSSDDARSSADDQTAFPGWQRCSHTGGDADARHVSSGAQGDGKSAGKHSTDYHPVFTSSCHSTLPL